MQMKSSYRVLKWMFLVGAMATLGTACVVTSGDGDDDGEGGEGGTDTTTAGKNSTSGSGGTSSAGTSAGGKGGTASAGTNAGGSAAGGEGGAPDTYVPGVCDDTLKIPSMPRDTALNADDEKPEFACRKCLKTSCGDEWATCYGEAPTAACGYGSTEDAPGQFECVRLCVLEDTSGDDLSVVLPACDAACLDQCEDADQGFTTEATGDLVECGTGACLAECFTPE
jgi:hypothetical protein